MMNGRSSVYVLQLWYFSITSKNIDNHTIVNLKQPVIQIVIYLLLTTDCSCYLLF